MQANSLIEIGRHTIAGSAESSGLSQIEVGHAHSTERSLNLRRVVMCVCVTTVIQQFKLATPPRVALIQQPDARPERHPQSAEVSFESARTGIPSVELSII